MKKLTAFITALLFTTLCFSQGNYNVSTESNSWEYLNYSNLIDSVNSKQNDGSSWQVLKFYVNSEVSDLNIERDIFKSKYISEVIDKLGEVHLDIPCKSSTKDLVPISNFYYTINSNKHADEGIKIVMLMYPI